MAVHVIKNFSYFYEVLGGVFYQCICSCVQIHIHLVYIVHHIGWKKNLSNIKRLSEGEILCHIP